MPKVPGLLGIYWPARKESLSSCTDRTYATLRKLRQCGYERFLFLGRSRAEALKRQFEVTRKNVGETLVKGVNRTDTDGKAIPELGWRISFWSGDTDGAAYSISVFCGSCSRFVINSVVMNLPPFGPHSLSMANDRAKSAFNSLILIWKPEQGILCEGSIAWNDGEILPERKPIARYRRCKA